jgi:predicted lipid-binding transport protein (Tim44 family)
MGALDGSKRAKDVGAYYDTETELVDDVQNFIENVPAPEAAGVDMAAVKQTDPTFDDRQFIAAARESFMHIRAARTSDDEQLAEGLLSPQLLTEVKTAIDGDVASHQHHLLPGLEIQSAAITTAQVVDGKLQVIVRFHLWAMNPSEAPVNGIDQGDSWDEDWTFWRDPTVDASTTDHEHALRREVEGGWLFAHKGWIVTSISRAGADTSAG